MYFRLGHGSTHLVTLSSGRRLARPINKSPERKRRDLTPAVRDPPAYAGGFYSGALCGRDIDVSGIAQLFQELLAILPREAERPNVCRSASSWSAARQAQIIRPIVRVFSARIHVARCHRR